jgi:hypothetical protein
MPSLFYFALGCLAGWLVGRRSKGLEQAMRGASDVLDRVDRLAAHGSLTAMDGLRLTTGDDRRGVQLSIKSRSDSYYEDPGY